MKNPIEEDFYTIKNNVDKEHIAFTRKLQNNMDYYKFVKNFNVSYNLFLVLTLLFCLVVCGAIILVSFIWNEATTYAIIIGVTLILLSIIMLSISLARRLRLNKSTSKRGLYYMYYNVETSFEQLSEFMNSINMQEASEAEKISFYTSLSSLFGAISGKLGALYATKKAKVDKLPDSKQVMWADILVYTFNLGKYCLNKQKDIKTFAKLTNM